MFKIRIVRARFGILALSDPDSRKKRLIAVIDLPIRTNPKHKTIEASTIPTISTVKPADEAKAIPNPITIQASAKGIKKKSAPLNDLRAAM